MIELVFVIVVLGILASIAIPRLSATRDDATVSKMRSDLASIRSGISLKRSEAMIRGDVSWPCLHGAEDKTTKSCPTPTAGGSIFGNVLQAPLYDKGASTRNGWKIDGNNIAACVAGTCTTFTYDITKGSFDCKHTEQLCKQLAE